MKSLVMGVGFQGRISRNPTRQIGCLLAKKNYNSDKENVAVLNGMGVVYRRRSLPRLGPGRPPAHEGRARGRGQARERAASGSGLERAPGHQEGARRHWGLEAKRQSRGYTKQEPCLRTGEEENEAHRQDNALPAAGAAQENTIWKGKQRRRQWDRCSRGRRSPGNRRRERPFKSKGSRVKSPPEQPAGRRGQVERAPGRPPCFPAPGQEGKRALSQAPHRSRHGFPFKFRRSKQIG